VAERSFVWTSAIPESDFKRYLDVGVFRKNRYEKGQVIHFEGDYCGALGILIEGHAVVERIDISGGLIRIREMFPGDLLGGNLIFSQQPYFPMTITAVTAVEVLAMDRAILFEICAENRTFLAAFLEHISNNTLHLGDRIKHTVSRSVRERVILFLRREQTLQQADTIVLRMSKKALAERLGVQRTSLSRTLQKMREEGLITYDAKQITICDREFLEEI
jgi:CRP-like cAMP-binding protein